MGQYSIHHELAGSVSDGQSSVILFALVASIADMVIQFAVYNFKILDAKKLFT